MQKNSPLTVAQREAIYRSKLHGQSLRQIAAELGRSYAVARKWWRVGRTYGDTGLRNQRAPRATSPPMSSFDARVASRALELKQQHPRRGPTRILHELAQDAELSELRLPKRSVLAAYFRQICPELLAKRSTPPAAPRRAQVVHDLWQIDSKENLRLQDGTIATVLDVREPVACLWLGNFAHATNTAKSWRKLTLAEVQADLRQVFCEYGLPRGIQTDREHIYGQPASEAFPTRFTLWLAGLGIEHQFSRAGQPTDQAQVERGHRTWSDWLFAPTALADLPNLQAALTQARQTHASALPSHAGDCAGRPPLVAHPEARHIWRPYHPAAEGDLFHLTRVDDFLAQWTWQYKVTRSGQVYIQDRAYYLGTAIAGQTVDMRFDPADRHFVFTCAQSGDSLKRLPARGLDAATLTGLPDLLPPLPYPLQLSFPI